MDDKGDYSNFVSRMTSFDMDLTLPHNDDPFKDVRHSGLNMDDMVLHDGVKGMKWGVVKWRKPSGASGKKDSKDPVAKKSKESSGIKQHWDSKKREREWSKILKDVGTMNTKDIATTTRRLSLENEFKKLSKSKVATAKDKKGYLNREKMGDQELTRKVTRLRAINALNSQVTLASKEQREFGKRVVMTGGAIGLKYALNKKVSVGDVYESVVNPKAAKDQAVKSLLDFSTKKLKAKVTGK